MAQNDLRNSEFLIESDEENASNGTYLTRDSSSADIPYDNMNSNQKCTALFVITDIGIWFALAILSFLLAYNFTGVEPVHRGFFCDDQSISYPYRNDSVPDEAAVLLCVGMPIVFMVILEAVHLFTSKERVARGNKMTCKKYGVELYRNIGIFLAGAAGILLLTEAIKLYAGRLRPHFLAICDPDFSKVNCSHGYITTENICRGDNLSRLIDARKSFPSGHASLAAYGGLYLLIYLQARFIWRRPRLFLPTVQLALAILMVYIGVSRVTDNKHHAGDVIAGFGIGMIVCLFVVKFMSNLLKKTRTITSLLPQVHSAPNLAGMSTDPKFSQNDMELKTRTP